MKKIIITILFLSLAGCSSQLGADLQEPVLKEWEKVDSPLKLKASKDKILQAVEADECVEYDKDKIDCLKTEKVKKYHYVSDKKVEKQTYTYKDKTSKKETILQEDLSKRTKNSVHFKLPKDDLLGATETGDTYIAKFYSGSPFYEDENGDYYQVEVATTTIEAYEAQASSTEDVLGASGDPVYAGSGDGGILAYNTGSSPSQSTWDSTHDWDGSSSGTSGLKSDTTDSSNTYSPRVTFKSITNGTQIGRSFFPIDTSGLDSGITITDASFFIYAESISSDGAIDLGLVQTSQSSNTGISLTDFDQCGSINSPTEGASRITASTAAYEEFVLNSTGKSWIDDTGYTNLGVRNDYDLDDTLPSNPTSHRPVLTYSEQTGTSEDPYLEITYTDGGGGEVEVEKQSEFWF